MTCQGKNAISSSWSKEMATFSLNDTIRRVVGTGNGSNPDFNFSFRLMPLRILRFL